MAMNKNVLIIGGGFGGLNTAKELAGHADAKVILVDERNYHLFQPLLYQVATAGLNPGDIAAPIRAQFSDAANVEIHLGRVDGVDLEKRIAYSESQELKYDYLVIACGAKHSYFAHPEWEEFAPGLKTLEQATEIRRRVLSAFEQAENESDEEKKRALMTFVVVGAGPTGVELAGAIADISRTVLRHDFKRIDTTKSKVILVEAGPKVLSAFAPQLSAKAEKDLKEIGVDVRLNTKVENIDATSVTVGTEKIPTFTAIWAAGVQAAKISFRGGNVETDRAGRIKVKKDFSLPADKNVFVIGDMASFEYEPGHFLPGLAPVAIQSGKHVAKAILADVQGKVREDFQYFDKGQMATIGKSRAIAQVGKLKITGRLAWIAWLVIHVFYLIGFKNRIAVLSLWTWSYLFSQRGSRLILGKDWKLEK
jgi:NADH:ubiquinone reductase (H+-translocating)